MSITALILAWMKPKRHVKRCSFAHQLACHLLYKSQSTEKPKINIGFFNYIMIHFLNFFMNITDITSAYTTLICISVYFITKSVKLLFNWMMCREI